jgi:hypothetical protein
MTALADVIRDVRYAASSLLRTPGFTIVAVAVLALGIGATSAIFSLVTAVWRKPLPFANAERIVSLWIDNPADGGPARGEITPAYYADWREHAQSFEEMAPVVPGTVNLTGDGGDEALRLVGRFHPLSHPAVCQFHRPLLLPSSIGGSIRGKRL